MPVEFLLQSCTNLSSRTFTTIAVIPGHDDPNYHFTNFFLPYPATFYRVGSQWSKP